MEDKKFDFKRIAQEATLLSPVMAGREKLKTEEVVDQEFTIIEFGFAPKIDEEGNTIYDPETGEIDTFGVVVFSEMPDRYYSVGKIFTNVCHMWAAPFDSAEEASAALAAEGGVRVKFTSSKTKKGKNLVAVQILN